MRFFDKKQAIFITIIVISLTYFLASIIVFFLLGVKPLQLLGVWQFSALFELIFYSDVPMQVRENAFLSILIALILSLLLPLIFLIKINKKTKPFRK